MTYPIHTFELRISFARESDNLQRVLDKKNEVIEWLKNVGVNEFVEGVVDDLDIDHEYGLQEENLFEKTGGDLSPISVYKFSKEYIDELHAKFRLHFSSASIETQIFASETSEWVEGWKKSFEPVETQRFYIHPPWIKPKTRRSDGLDLCPIEIEPAMAFGTGQHATTRLCLELIEQLGLNGGSASLQGWNVCDVGTGTGILSIGCVKLGAAHVLATDIDPDAIAAARSNIKVNHCEDRVDFLLGPLSLLDQSRKFELVVANILAVVLDLILAELCDLCARNGYLLMSGVLVDQADELIQKTLSKKFELIQRHSAEGWDAILFRRIG